MKEPDKAQSNDTLCREFVEAFNLALSGEVGP
ncbi:hypothetical protein HNR20_000400 [Micromonospora parathelypteridis]|uniref:Uncharacterized protein n=1 Tax=Micromonospora parathelypteridis TaxID=1839617 RepID=A0A840VGW9_9ACTN|nr:hypothetical protein [Micromonospora parathelypteridis]